MSEDLELTMAKEDCKPTQYYPDQIEHAKGEEKPKRERSKYFAVIVASDSQFDCVIIAEDKKDLEKQIAKLTVEYDSKGMDFSIANIFKGHEVSFKETKAIEFL